MDIKDGFLAMLIILGIGLAIFSEHYRPVLLDMVTLTTALLIPLFFIILAAIILLGPNLFDMPGVKAILTVLLVLLLFGGVSATLGSDVAAQISGNAVNTNQVFFSKDFLNAMVILVVGLFLFFMVLVKK